MYKSMFYQSFYLFYYIHVISKWNNKIEYYRLILIAYLDDDEFYDLPSDLPSDGEITPTNETMNNGSISTNNTSNGLVEKALEKVENELIELDPEEKQQRKLFQTVDVSNLGTSLLT